jgi:hypothetical protein
VEFLILTLNAVAPFGIGQAHSPDGRRSNPGTSRRVVRGDFPTMPHLGS